MSKGIAPRDNPKYVLMTYELRGSGEPDNPYYEVKCLWDKETLEKLGEI